MYNFLYKYITPIFGYMMLFFYGIVNGFNGSYGIAIILFTIFARLIMIPTTISQQKGMAKQQRLAPKIRRIQEKYAGDQQKIQEETQNLYAREGYNPMTAGCLPLLIQMPFIIGLFGVLYNPLRYAIGLDGATADLLTDTFGKMISSDFFKKLVESGAVEEIKANQDRYFSLYAIQHFDIFKQYIAENGVKVSQAALDSIQNFIDLKRFTFFGFELGVVPKFDLIKDPQKAKYVLVPIISGLTSLASALITQAQQKKTNPQANAPGAGCTMLMMPAMSLWFTSMFPCGIGVYWITSNVFATVQTLVMKKIYSPQKNVAKLMIKESVERRSRENSIKRIKK